MKMIEQLKAKMESIGGSLDPDCDYTIHLDAPAGYVWRANGSPAYHIQWANNRQTWLAEAIKNESESLAMGLEKVTDLADLKYIQHDLDDDNWIAPADAPDRIEWPK